MDISKLPIDGVITQLGLISGRLKEKIRDLSERIPDVDDLITHCFDSVGTITQSVMTEINNIVDRLVGTGLTMTNAAGDIFRLIKQTTSYGWVVRSVDVDSQPVGDAIMVMNENIMKFDSDTQFMVENAVGKVESLENLLAYHFGEATTELSLWQDTISSCLAGAWENASQYVSFMGDKLSTFSNGALTSFMDIKETLSHNSTLAGFANALLNKFNMNTNVVDENKIEVSDTRGIWHITTINLAAIASGIASASQLVANILMYTGGAVVKAAGAVISTISTLVKNFNATIDEKTEPQVEENSWLPCWYGELLTYTIDDTTFARMFPDVLESPFGVDCGFGRFIFTQEQKFNVTTKVYDNVWRVRYYQNACINGSKAALGALAHILQDHGLHTAVGPGLINNKVVLLDDQPAFTHEQLKAKIETWYENYAITCDEFEQLNSEDQSRAYLMSLFLMGFSIDTMLGSRWACTIPNSNFVVYSQHLENLTHADYKLLFENDFYHSDLGNVRFGLGLGDIAAGMIVHHDANDTAPSWVSLVELNNAWYEFNLYDPVDNPNPYFQGYIFNPFRERSLTMLTMSTGGSWNSDTATADSYTLFLDWDSYSDAYRANWYSVSSVSALVRYYPPKISQALATFIKVMEIAIAIGITAIAAVYAYKRITRNRRQMKKYAEWNAASEAYKDDPNSNNARALRKAERSLRWDTKLYGSSKYLSSLSGAKFGWDSGDDTETGLSLKSSADDPIEKRLIEIRALIAPDN